MNTTEQFLSLTGSRLPIIQAPMAGGVHDHNLVIAVCRSGAIGSLPAAFYSPEKLKEVLSLLNSELGTLPYNVNFFAHKTPAVTEEQRQKWLQTLAPFYRELNVSEKDIPIGGGRQPFSQEFADIVSEFRPKIVSFHFGLPEQKLLQQIKDSGAVVMSSATTVDEALWLYQNGADIIIAQGIEAGGHRGWFLNHNLAEQLSLSSLLPQICQKVNIPIIATGGISDDVTARAARDLGAAGVQVGTAFLLADEATTKQAHREALQSERARHTVVTNLFSGGCARGMINRYIEEAGPINENALPFPLAQSASAPLKTAAEAKNCYDFSSFWAGQNAPLAKKGTATEIVNRIAQAFDD